MTLAQLSQADLNTYGLGILTIAGGAYGLYQKFRTDRATEAAKLRGDTITELKETVARQEAEYTAMVLRKDKELAAEVARVEHFRNLYTESERERAAQVARTRETIEAEEAKQTKLRHEMRDELRGQANKIYDLETENKRLKVESDRLRQESEHQRGMILALTDRIAALEQKGAGIIPVMIANRADQPVPVAGTADRKDAEDLAAASRETA